VNTNNATIGNSIVRASFSVSIAHILFKLIGLLLVIAAGIYLDGGTYDVVYAFAFEGCIFSLFLIGDKTIGPAFLPIFKQEIDIHNEQSAWRFANVILTVQLLILLFVVFLIFFFPDSVIQLVTYWTPNHNQAKYMLARKALLWLLPALVFLSLGSTTYMILNGYKRFFLAAFGDVSWKICVLLSIVIGMGIFQLNYRAIIFGLLVGSMAKLATHLIGLRREIHFCRLSAMLREPAVKQMFLLLLPLIAGVIFATIRDVYNNVKILSYLDTEGLMKANSFGRKFYTAIAWLVPYAVSIAMFPFMCEWANKGDKKRFGDILSQAGRIMLSVFVPFSLVCAVLALPLSSVLFKAGHFTITEVRWTAASLSCYILVLPAYAIEYLIVNAFYAYRKMVLVTVVGIIFSIVSMAISYAGIVVFGFQGTMALAVIALGYTVSRTLKTTLMICLFKRIVSFFPFGETILFLGRTLIVGLVSAGLCMACRIGFDAYVSSSEAKHVLLVKLLACGITALVGFMLSVKIVKLKEPVMIYKWAIDYIRSRLNIFVSRC